MNRFFVSLCCASAVGCASGIDVLGLQPTCIPEVRARIVVADGIAETDAANVVLLAASKTGDVDVTGIDHQGVPSGRGALKTLAVGTGARDQTLTAAGSPYTTWFVAFIDSNGDRRLDVDEPMGVDPRNPHPDGCEPRVISIEIDRLRQL